MYSSTKAGLLALAITLVIPLSAQTTGIISGRITDSSGAIVPEAQVVVTQTATNVDSVSKTNSEGVFHIPSLIAGPYRIAISATGFKKQIRDGLTLRIGENLNLDLSLDVGSVTEAIEVKASASMLETQTSSTGQVMSGDYFYKLPNNQHWSKAVLAYTPQVGSRNAPWAGALGDWTINGGNSFQTAQYEDGIMAGSMDGGTSLNTVVIGVEEVKVITSAMPAEYGHATSGALIFVKKAGTNQFHGQGGYLFKSTSMMHRSFFQRQTIQQQGKDNKTLLQMPDFTVGGPIMIPKIYNGRNKTFFNVAGSYHMDSSSNASSYTSPTAAMLNGDFSAFSNQIYDPFSTTGSFAAGNLQRTPFPGNIIPKNRFSSMWNRIAANSPFRAPQDGVGSITNTGPQGNIIESGTGNYFNLTTQVRVDHTITEKLKTTASYSGGNQRQPRNNVNIVYTPYDNFQHLNYTIQNHAALALTYTLSPSLISETRLGMYRRSNNGRSRTGENYLFEMAKTVPNLPENVYLNPINFGLTQGTNGSNMLGVGTLEVNINQTRQFNQDFTKVSGNHVFKFGYEFLWMDHNRYNISNPRLTLNFGGTNGLQGNGNGIANTGGITLADIMLGAVYSYQYQQQGPSLTPVTNNHSFYFQDDWRIRPNLTLNLGLRYSNETPAHSKNPGGLSVGSLDVADNFYTSGSVPGVLRCPPGGCKGGWIQPNGFLWNRDNNNLRPRVGLAWNVTENTVIRSGFAMITLDWNLGWTNQNEIGGANFLNQSVGNPANVYTPLFSIDGGVPAFVSPTPLADGSIPTTAAAPANRPTITVVPKNYRNPYTMNWNFSIQRAIKRDFLLELSYVGSRNVGFAGNYNWQSRPYGTGIDPNGNVIDLTLPENWAYRNTWVNNNSGVNGTQAYKPFPNLGGVNYQCNCVNRSYHSGTVKLEKRYSAGLSFLTFATLQKAIENAPGNLYQDPNLMRAVTNLNQKYRFVSTMNYELPFGKGRKWMSSSNRILDAVFGGYSFSWNYSVWAPTPLNLDYTGGTYLNPVTGSVSGTRQDYPNYQPTLSNRNLVKMPELRDNWQDIGTNRFVTNAQNPMITNCGNKPILQPNGATLGNECVHVAPSFTRGNMPNNFFIPQRIIGANAAIFKDFRMTERVRSQIRLDFYNPFKWYNWGPVNTTMNQANPQTFGTPAQSDFGDSTQGGPPQLHLSLRVHF